MMKKLTVALILAGIVSALLTTAAYAADGWEILFNGKDLTGWDSLTDKRDFTVVDGAIRANAVSKQMGHLFFTGDLKDGFVRFKDFELELLVRGESNSNSGIFIHTDTTTRANRRYLNTGYEIQLNSTEREKRKTGSLYDVVDLDKSLVDETKWFRVNITVINKRITVKLNGQQVVDYTEPAKPVRSERRKGRVLKPEGGGIALQAHDMKSVFYFKDIRIKRLCAESHASAAAREKPMNVLFLVVDDLNTWLLGDTNRYAGKVVAPNILRLADSGVVFSRAYTASPFCCPSRTALLSGVSPWKSGVYQNGQIASESLALQNATSLAKLFKEAGYSTASYGKIGHGWDTRAHWDDHIPHKRDPSPPNAPLTPVGRGEQDWGPTHLREDQMRDTTYADAAIKQLQKQHDKPFLIACGLFHPHMPWYVPQKYFDMFPLDEVTTPELMANDLDDVPPLGRAVTAGKSKFVASVMEHGLHRRGVQGYLASTAYADAQIGRVLDALDKSPYRNNTLVVFMTDHGFHLAEKNHWQKGTLWEEATHCLLMFRVPGLTQAGGKCERFVSLQDIYPTLAELCGIEPPSYTDGRSLVPLLKRPDAAWQSTAISALYDRYVSIRTEGFRYIRYCDGQEEFYDCAKDPHEWTNQIGNPAYATAIRALRTAVPAQADMALPIPSKKRKKK
jgi:arylsulfatase A-like enzyme